MSFQPSLPSHELPSHFSIRPRVYVTSATGMTRLPGSIDPGRGPVALALGCAINSPSLQQLTHARHGAFACDRPPQQVKCTPPPTAPSAPCATDRSDFRTAPPPSSCARPPECPSHHLDPTKLWRILLSPGSADSRSGGAVHPPLAPS